MRIPTLSLIAAIFLLGASPAAATVTGPVAALSASESEGASDSLGDPIGRMCETLPFGIPLLCVQNDPWK